MRPLTKEEKKIYENSINREQKRIRNLTYFMNKLTFQIDNLEIEKQIKEDALNQDLKNIKEELKQAQTILNDSQDKLLNGVKNTEEQK